MRFLLGTDSRRYAFPLFRKLLVGRAKDHRFFWRSSLPFPWSFSALVLAFFPASRRREQGALDPCVFCGEEKPLAVWPPVETTGQQERQGMCLVGAA